VYLVIGGYMPFVWDSAGFVLFYFRILNSEHSSLFQEIMTTAVFLFFLTLHDTLISLPFSLYKTFQIEQAHGFNKTTMRLFLKDKLISLALTMGIGFPIVSIVVWLVRWGGPYFYFYVWTFLFVVSVIMMTIFPVWIAPLFNKYTPLENGPLYEAIEKLAKSVDFPLTKIFLVDGSKRSAHSNAYFYGFFKNKRIVLYDTLVEQVEQPELLAILGHEIGHWRLWHTIQGFVIAQVYSFCLFLAFSFVQNNPGLYSSFGFYFRPQVSPPVFIGLVLFSQTFWSPVDKILSLIMNFNSRANEFAADRYAAKLGMGEDLCKGLIKISIENLGNMVPDPWYSMYHFSHPPLVERLRAINPEGKKFDVVIKKKVEKKEGNIDANTDKKSDDKRETENKKDK
jgi:STE24 endopeptidase